MKNNLTLRAISTHSPTEIDWDYAPIVVKHRRLQLYALVNKRGGSRRTITFLGGEDCEEIRSYDIIEHGQLVGSFIRLYEFIPFSGTIELSNPAPSNLNIVDTKLHGLIDYPIYDQSDAESRDQLVVWGNHVVLVINYLEEYADVMVVGKTTSAMIDNIDRPVGFATLVKLNDLTPFRFQSCRLYCHDQPTEGTTS